jgi:translocation and assembly module TamB
VTRRVIVVLAAALLLAPAWLLGTEGGLRAAARAATALTGGQLSIGAAEGRLIDDVALRDIAWRSDTVSVEIDRAEVNLRWSRLLLARIQAEHLALGTLAITVRDAEGAPEPQPEPQPLTVRAPLRLAVEDGRLDAFRLRLAGWQQDWTLAQVRFGARWRDEWIVIGALSAETAEAGPVELRGRIAIVEDLLRLVDVEARGPATLVVDGALALDDGASNALVVAWQELRVPGGRAPWFHSRAGEARLEGPWRGFAWRTRAELQLQDVPATLVAEGRGDGRGLDIARADLRALDGALRGRGRLDWSPGLAADLALDWQGVNPGRAWAQWAGVLSGSGRMQAQFGTPLRLDFDAALRDSQLRGYPFALRAVGRTEGGTVTLRELRLQSGPSTLTARGALLPELALSGELRSPDLGSLWAGLAGAAELQASAAGPPAAPRITARGVIDDLAYAAVNASRVTLDADVNLAPRGRSRVDVSATGFAAGALKLQSLTLDGAGTRAAHRLVATARSRDGSARLAVSGAERAGAWRGSLDDVQVQPPGGEAWTLEEPAALAFARGRLSVAPACLAAARSRACAQLGLAAGAQEFALRVHAFDLAHVRAWLSPEWVIVGALSGTASLRLVGGELRQFRADLDATAGRIEGGGVRLDYGPGALNVGPDGERLHAELQLRPAGGEVSAEVWLSPGPDLLDRPMLGDLRVRLPDLAWLPVLSPEIAAAQGSLDANLHVSGTPREPSLHGALQLAGGRVQLTTPGIELTDMTASFERGRDAPLVLRAQAASGGGTLHLEGELKSLEPIVSGALTIKGENVLGINRSDIRAWLSPDLALALEGNRARLTGELRVPRAEITPRELDRGGIGPSSDQVVVEAEREAAAGGPLRIETEVRIVLGEQVRFDGLGLKTQLTGAITAYDDAQRATRARGELRLDGGRYKAYGQELQIETGRLIFTGGPVTDPAIDITAIRKPREDIKVGLRARGTLDAPEFSLFSEPAMSQEEQLSWLVLGRSLSATLDSQQRTELAGAAMSLGLSGGHYLAQQLAPRLGLDEVSLGARPGETTDLARFTIGKYLSPKLFVSYGYGLFQPGHFFRLQYDVGRRFKLVGETGLQQGGDLLYTIER